MSLLKSLARGVAAYYTGGASEAYFQSKDAAGRSQGAVRNASGIQSEAARRAAELKAKAFGETIPILQDQLSRTQQQFDPFIQAGAQALPELQQGFQNPEGTSLEGLDSIISQIMGGDAFSGLIDKRTQAVQGQLAAGGLTRSGRGLEEAAAIPTDLALDLESQLYNRQFAGEGRRISGLENLVSGGRSATGADVNSSNQIITNIINAITGKAGVEGKGITGAAEADASGILGSAQIDSQNIQNLLNLGGTLGSAYLLRPKTAKLKPTPQLGYNSGNVTSQPSIFNT